MSSADLESPHGQVVRTLYAELLRCWNRRDARGVAALFTEQARFVGMDGHEVAGRGAIEHEVLRMFEVYAGRSSIGIVRTVTSLSDGVALVAAVAGMYHGGGRFRVDPTVNVAQTLIAVREHDRWRFGALQSTLAALPGRPELARRLTHDLDRVLAFKATATTRS